jgi:hypothetical protein
VPEPGLAKAVNLAAPKFLPPARETSQPTPKPAVVEDDDEEGVNVDADVNAQDEYEYSGKSATQIEDDVKDLFKGTAVNHEVEIKEGGDIVDKFTDDFRLLRHQIQARVWMKERESGNSRGGILADDMGSVLLVIVLTWKAESVPDLVKPFKPSFALWRESLTGTTEKEVTFRQRCGSHLAPRRF